MSSQLQMPPPGFEELSVEEQIEYVQMLWDYIASSPNNVPVPDWHKEILEERLARYRQNGMEGTIWDESEEDELITQD
jgi:putative addiction module component (TIGR02574 family)